MPSTYRPTNKRANVIRLLCQRWVKRQEPEVYKQFLRHSEMVYPKGKAGRKKSAASAG